MKGRWKNVLFGGVSMPLLAEIGELALRAFAGLAMALTHGKPFLPPPDMMIGGVESMGFPMPTFFAWAAKLSEFIGGLLIAVGFLTRPAAFFLASTMAVAAFVAHKQDPFARKEMALLYLAISLFFMLKGAGRLSVDGLLRSR